MQHTHRQERPLTTGKMKTGSEDSLSPKLKRSSDFTKPKSSSNLRRKTNRANKHKRIQNTKSFRNSTHGTQANPQPPLSPLTKEESNKRRFSKAFKKARSIRAKQLGRKLLKHEDIALSLAVSKQCNLVRHNDSTFTTTKLQITDTCTHAVQIELLHQKLSAITIDISNIMEKLERSQLTHRCDVPTSKKFQPLPHIELPDDFHHPKLTCTQPEHTHSYRKIKLHKNSKCPIVALALSHSKKTGRTLQRRETICSCYNEVIDTTKCKNTSFYLSLEDEELCECDDIHCEHQLAYPICRDEEHTHDRQSKTLTPNPKCWYTPTDKDIPFKTKHVNQFVSAHNSDSPQAHLTSPGHNLVCCQSCLDKRIDFVYEFEPQLFEHLDSIKRLDSLSFEPTWTAVHQPHRQDGCFQSTTPTPPNPERFIKYKIQK